MLWQLEELWSGWFNSNEDCECLSDGSLTCLVHWVLYVSYFFWFWFFWFFCLSCWCSIFVVMSLQSVCLSVCVSVTVCVHLVNSYIYCCVAADADNVIKHLIQSQHRQCNHLLWRTWLFDKRVAVYWLYNMNSNLYGKAISLHYSAAKFVISSSAVD